MEGRCSNIPFVKMRAFPLCTQVVVTRFEEIENAAKNTGDAGGTEYGAGSWNRTFAEVRIKESIR